MTRFGMAIDMARCTGCQTCVVACQMHHALRPGVAWCAVDALEWGRWPDADRAFLPHACLHCDEPLCVSVCPTAASHKRDDGTVAIDEARCIGCGVCLTACPYGARTLNREDAWHFGAPSPAPYETEGEGRVGVAEKCTFCIERVQVGLLPACVEACPVEARAFGDLDDPESPASAFAAETGARPVPGTGVLYADGGRGLDIGRVVTERYYAPASRSQTADGRVGKGNPAVVAGAGAAAAALAAAAGLAAKRNRDRRAKAQRRA